MNSGTSCKFKIFTNKLICSSTSRPTSVFRFGQSGMLITTFAIDSALSANRTNGQNHSNCNSLRCFIKFTRFALVDL